MLQGITQGATSSGLGVNRRPADALFSAASMECSASQPQTVRASSLDAGWKCVLLDELEGAGRSDIFEPATTRDLGIVVAAAGEHAFEDYARGQWRRSIYRAGCVGMHASGRDNRRLRWDASRSRSPFTTLHLYIPPELVAETAEEYRLIGSRGWDRPLEALVFKDYAISHTVIAMLAEMKENAPDFYAEQAARWLVTHLLAAHAQWWDPSSDNRSAEFLDDRRLNRAMEYMSANVRAALSLGEVAAEAGISVHHFSRLFRTRVGITPFAYLTQLRIGQAKRLLSATDMAVQEIAAECGYQSAAAFTTAFLRNTGVAPTRYRRARRTDSL